MTIYNERRQTKQVYESVGYDTNINSIENLKVRFVSTNEPRQSKNYLYRF